MYAVLQKFKLFNLVLDDEIFIIEMKDRSVEMNEFSIWRLEPLEEKEYLKELYKFFSQIYTNGLRRKGILYDIWLSICLLEDLAGIKVSTPIRMISPEIFIYMEDYYSFLIKYINEDCEVELKSIIDPKMRVHCKPGIEDSILEVINIVKS